MATGGSRKPKRTPEERARIRALNAEAHARREKRKRERRAKRDREDLAAVKLAQSFGGELRYCDTEPGSDVRYSVIRRLIRKGVLAHVAFGRYTLNDGGLQL
jgi:hypothetical protein